MATPKDKLIASAQKLVEKGQHDKAIKEYLKVVQLDDKDVRIWLKIGDLFVKTGKKPEAAETYQKVAQFYSEQGFYLKAVAVYKQILKLEPRQIEIHHRLAELYKQLGLLSDAMQQFEAIAAHYSSEGKSREALAALKQIIELDPETVASRIKLAELYSKEGMPREAIDEFTRAAEQLKAQGRTDDYMKVAERLLFHSPDNRVVAKELAALYIEKADPRHALPKLQVCFKADPRDVGVLALLAQAFEALDQVQKAVSVLKELARICMENNDRAARDEAFRKILALSPGDADAEAALGVAKRGPAAPPSRSQPRLGASWQAPPEVVDDAPGDSQASYAPDVEDEEEAPAEDSDSPQSVEETAGSGLDPEAVARILNETDVYIKYKLYQKAIEHVQRVFEHEPRNVEAREKLKALYLSIGRRDDAVLELWALAEQAEPGRQRRYLREILELDPAHPEACAMLGVEPTPRRAPAPVDAEADMGVAAAGGDTLEEDQELLNVEDLEEIPDDDLDAAGGGDPRGQETLSGAPQRGDAEDDLIPLVVDPASDSRQAAPDSAIAEDRFGLDDDGLEAADAAEDRFGLPDDTGPPPEPTREAFRSEETVPPSVGEHTPAFPVEPSVDIRTRFEDHAGMGQALAVGDSGPELDELPAMPRQDSNTVPSASLRAPDEGSLEDDLDEADFFIQQSLFEEAREMLEGLLERFPGHPLVGAKLRDLEAAMAGPADGEMPGAEPQAISAADLSAAPPDEMPGNTAPDMRPSEPVEVTRKGVVEKGVTAEDYETHYDLGIAYKEMGLLDDAMNEFNLVMKDPTREVQCHLMIGLCHLEKGTTTEAIGSFKRGLYVEGISERESLSLYFELGQAYERLGDPREALYYYEKVLKRDPRFRNVERLVETLRGGGAPSPEGPAPGGEELDAAFDGLLGPSDS